MNRRTLLKLGLYSAMTLPSMLQSKQTLGTFKRAILIELKGGNDGLNTVIPYSNPVYYRLRPNIAIDKGGLVPLNKHIGLHSSLNDMKEMFDNGELAIVQGVGYPNPNRSHFRSIDIWDTASSSNEYLETGWLKSLHLNTSKKQLKGVVLGGDYGPFDGISKGVIKINNIKEFFQQSKQIHSRISPIGNNPSLLHLLKTEAEIQKSAHLLHTSLQKSHPLAFAFKKSKFNMQMETTTKLINSQTPISLFKVSLGSFDTHINQTNKHARLLKELSEAISTLRKNLIKSGEWDNTVIMTYSEFGRRAAENSNKGTDHGTAAPHFIIGGKVKGGIYGKHASLEKLDVNKDLIYTTDFRSMYESIAQGFFHTQSERTKGFPTFNIV